MAYTKTIWAAGDTVTSQKLNKIENQLETLSNGGAGCLAVNITPDTTNNDTIYVADKTYNEIITAFLNGSLPIGVTYSTSGGLESWSVLLFRGAESNVDNLVYRVVFGPGTGFSGGLVLYATNPNSILTSEVPGGQLPK